MPRNTRQDIIRKLERGINLSENIVEHLSYGIEILSEGNDIPKMIEDLDKGMMTEENYRYAKQLAPLIGLVMIQLSFQDALRQTLERI